MSTSIRCLCEHCKSEIQGELIVEDNHVYYEKQCENTGLCARYKKERTLISTDWRYYAKCVTLTKKRRRLISNMCVIELTNDCNINCSICIAGSFPGAGRYKSFEKIGEMLVAVEKNRLRPEIIMLSGGEPTIHPDFNRILELAYRSQIQQVFLITNGVRLAEESQFAKYLSDFRDKLEIYLQFDSLNPSTLINIRGIDLSEVRKQSLKNLENHRIPTTLVCVVKKRANDLELNEIINYGLKHDCVRGVTFQPIKASGRHESFNKDSDTITLTEVRSRIIADSPYFTEINFIPHPVNPVNISIGYLLKHSKGIRSVTQSLLDTRRHKSAENLKRMMFFLPQLNSERFAYDKLFRVAIVSFMDVYNFNFDFFSSCNITTVTESNKMVPLDSYYLFDGQM